MLMYCQEGSQEAAEVYERKVVAEIRTRSDRQEAFPVLERDLSVRPGSMVPEALRGDIFMVRCLGLVLLLAWLLCACALPRLEYSNVLAARALTTS